MSDTAMKLKASDNYILSFSGGKDSTATLLYLLKEKGLRPHIIFCDTGNETPETYQYIDYISRLIESWGYSPIIKLKGEETFWEMAERQKIFPCGPKRFCTGWLKIVPTLRWLEGQPIQNQTIITGIRKQESPKRSKRKEFELSKIYGRDLWNPIIEWSVKEVFAIHDKYVVEPNPMYKKGFSRVGCFPCLYWGRNDLLALEKHFPERPAFIASWEKKLNAFFFAPRQKGKVHGNIYTHITWAKKEMYGQQSLPMEMPVCAYAELGLCE